MMWGSLAFLHHSAGPRGELCSCNPVAWHWIVESLLGEPLKSLWENLRESVRDEMDLMNNYRRLGSLSPECFHFPQLRNGFTNWVTWAQQGSCQASGVFICAWLSNHSQGQWPSGQRPHEALWGTAVRWVSPEALHSHKIPGSEVIWWAKAWDHTVRYYGRLLLVLGLDQCLLRRSGSHTWYVNVTSTGQKGTQWTTMYTVKHTCSTATHFSVTFLGVLDKCVPRDFQVCSWF